MDVEAALLEGSPTMSTMSTISSDCTEQTYAEDSSSSSNCVDSSGASSPTIDLPLFASDKVLVNVEDEAEGEDEEVEEQEDEEEEEQLTPKIVQFGRQMPRKPKFRIRPPYLMICISLIEIAVHCLGDDATLRDWLIYDTRQRIQGWRFISYMLLHSNALHLATNVLIQLLLATPLEVEQGRLAVGTIYLGGGVCGALGASLLQPNRYLVGASAGVYALLTSHLAHLYLCHGDLRYAGWRLVAVLLLAGADVASMPVPALLGYGLVGWAAHGAGGLAGPLIGLAVFPRHSKKDARGRSFVRFVRLVSAVSVTLLVVGAILGNVYLIALPQLGRPS